MDALAKTASICADVYLKKRAASFASSADSIANGVKEMARRDRILKSIRGKDSFPTWAKVLTALGGGKLLMDTMQNNNPKGWRQ